MYYWCPVREKKVRKMRSEVPEFLIDDEQPPKYIGILMEEREGMTAKDNIDRVKDKFRKIANDINRDPEGINSIAAENGQVFLNPWKNDSFNVTLNNLKD